MHMTTNRVVLSWNLLRYTYGAVLLLAGLDKIAGTDLIVEWAKYISPQVLAVVQNAGVFLLVMGVVEVVVAVMLVTKFERIAAYLSVAWLLLISVNLLMLGMIDIAIRDILLAVGALVLALLSDAVIELRRQHTVA